MSTPTPDGLKAEIDQGKMKVGNPVVDATGVPVATAAPMAVGADGNMAASLPTIFATGAANTGIAFASYSGSATGSANELMHLSLVKGSNATATIAGYRRVTITDAAGVITSGDYYEPFYTLA